MKHKKHWILLLLGVIFILGGLFFISQNSSVLADSGFDADWGGSSSSSGGSSWGDSSGDSWSGSSSSGSSGTSTSSPNFSELLKSFTPLEIILIYSGVILFAAFVLFLKVMLQKGSEKLDQIMDSAYLPILSPSMQYNNIIDEPAFVLHAFAIYQKIQIAWMHFDYETIKKYTTNELYNMYVSQLNTLKLRNQKNIMKKIKFYGGRIIDYKKEQGEFETITMQLQVTCKDYLIDQATKKVVRGSKSAIMHYTYELTFIRRKETEMKRCPNCGAPVEGNMTSQCSYCNSVIVHKKFDWVLSKKEMLFQTRL